MDVAINYSFKRFLFLKILKIFKKIFIVIKAVKYLKDIYKVKFKYQKVKLYGTSFDLYDLSTRDFKFVQN